MVMEYAVQPADSKRVLMSSNGIMMSTRRRQDLARRAEVEDDDVRARSPGRRATSDVAYAVGFDRSLWRTDDAGKTWKKVS